MLSRDGVQNEIVPSKTKVAQSKTMLFKVRQNWFDVICGPKQDTVVQFKTMLSKATLQ